jgi:hypothetical protein
MNTNRGLGQSTILLEYDSSTAYQRARRGVIELESRLRYNSQE